MYGKFEAIKDYYNQSKNMPVMTRSQWKQYILENNYDTPMKQLHATNAERIKYRKNVGEERYGVLSRALWRNTFVLEHCLLNIRGPIFA